VEDYIMPDWVYAFLEAVFAHLLWELLLALGMAGLIAYLKATKDKWAGPVLYGLSGFVLVFILGFTLTGHAPLSKEQPQTTSENVETNIKTWVDEFALGILKQSDPDAIFEYMVTLHNGTFVRITRTKEKDTYLTFSERLTVSPADKAVLTSLPVEEQKQIREALELEAARQKMANSIEGFPVVEALVLSKSIPITNNLTDVTFANYVDEMDSANVACRDALRLAVERFKPLPD
jgi:Uncharacterized conserved protein (DUF2299)